MPPRRIAAALAGIAAVAGLVLLGRALSTGFTFDFAGANADPHAVALARERVWPAAAVMLGAAIVQAAAGARISALLVALPGVVVPVMMARGHDAWWPLLTLVALALPALAGAVVGALPNVFAPRVPALPRPHLFRDALIGLPAVTLLASFARAHLIVALAGAITIFGAGRRAGVRAGRAATLAVAALMLATVVPAVAVYLLA